MLKNKREYMFTLNSTTYTKIVEAESRCVVYLNHMYAQAMGVYYFGINTAVSHFTFTYENNASGIVLNIGGYDTAYPHNVRYVDRYAASVELEAGECLYAKTSANDKTLKVIIFDKEV